MSSGKYPALFWCSAPAQGSTNLSAGKAYVTLADRLEITHLCFVSYSGNQVGSYIFFYLVVRIAHHRFPEACSQYCSFLIRLCGSGWNWFTRMGRAKSGAICSLRQSVSELKMYSLLIVMFSSIRNVECLLSRHSFLKLHRIKLEASMLAPFSV
jgi:hypothetical protein